jgi:hypothetical protein
MKWAEVLATFNFVAWLLPIIIRSIIAWKYKNDSRATLSDSDNTSIGRAVSKLNLRGKKLIVSNGAEANRDFQERSK